MLERAGLGDAEEQESSRARRYHMREIEGESMDRLRKENNQGSGGRLPPLAPGEKRPEDSIYSPRAVPTSLALQKHFANLLQEERGATERAKKEPQLKRALASIQQKAGKKAKWN